MMSLVRRDTKLAFEKTKAETASVTADKDGVGYLHKEFVWVGRATAATECNATASPATGEVSVRTRKVPVVATAATMSTGADVVFVEERTLTRSDERASGDRHIHARTYGGQFVGRGRGVQRRIRGSRRRPGAPLTLMEMDGTGRAAVRAAARAPRGADSASTARVA
ncbi:hypothetical protein HPB50_012997 [Hyalomma asiaticum]|uniref:Uncharacterized protein n=1 Tax=Hyalomma asiaticum TaxID=266040 RepID=A0ACB7S594_HYAAI|nr:hypothetical protein HPB50_012997 [Hyalomma asiaticum]